MPTSSLVSRSIPVASALFAVAFAVSACGAPPGDSDEASSQAAPITLGGCPVRAPQSGVACLNEGLVCSFGTDPRFGCRTQSVCGDAGWQTTVPSCTEPVPSCPAKMPKNVNRIAPCTDAQDGLTCNYGDESMTCAPFNGDLDIIKNGKPEMEWWSSGPRKTGCPDATPNYGSACSSEGLVCDYGGCFNDPAIPIDRGQLLVCSGARWERQNPICIE